jgi:hypothetical protein
VADQHQIGFDPVNAGFGASAQQQSGDKKQQSLSYKVLKTGKDEQQIRWQLSQKSKAGRIIVQEVNIFDGQGNLLHELLGGLDLQQRGHLIPAIMTMMIDFKRR